MISTQYVLLSYPIEKNTPMYGNTPPPVIKSYSRISEGAGSNSFTMNIHNHTGTHVDAAGHFVQEGRLISDYSIDELFFYDPLMVDCPAEAGSNIALKKAVSMVHMPASTDCLLLRTGFDKYRKERIYGTHNPGIQAEDILWLRHEFPSIRCIGIDSLSISGFQNREEGRKAHRAAFTAMAGREPLLLIEDMNLAPVPPQKLKKIILVPWQIRGIDSAPCTVIAEIES